MAAPSGRGGGRRVGRSQRERMDFFANVPQSTAELQKRSLDKLMANPNRPIRLPSERRGGAAADGEPEPPPDFVRFYMGSSAGAGSGEFHIYRHLRNKEQERLEFLEKKADKTEKDAGYDQLVRERREAEDKRTAKKRTKRQKQKQKQRQSGKKLRAGDENAEKKPSSSDDDSSDSDEAATTERLADNIET